jgi:hypothetical protein
VYHDGTTWAHTTNLYHNGGQVGISTIPGTNIRFDVKTNATSAVGMVIRRVSSQTANLLEFRNESDGVMSYFDEDGVFNGQIAGSGSFNPGFTQGSVVFQGSSAITQDNSNFYWDDTNNRLGIGTNAPTTALEIASGTNKFSFNPSESGSPVLRFTHTNVPQFRLDSAGNGAEIIVEKSGGIFAVNGNGTNTEFRVNTSGLNVKSTNIVGIGTIFPTAKLHVDGGYANNALAIFNQLNSGDILAASASGTTRFVVSNAGNVGIGTSSPSTSLHVVGTSTSPFIAQSSNGRVYLGATATEGIVASTNTTGGAYRALALETKSGYTMYLTTAGNVGINTTTPGARLDINGDLFAPVATFSANYAASVPLTVRGAPSGTGVLTNWVNNAGTELAFVNQSGSFASAGNIQAGSTGAFQARLASLAGASSGLVSLFRGAIGQTHNLTEWQNGSGTTLARFNQNGQLFAPYGEFVTTSSSLPALVVRGVSNQTAPIFRVQSSGSADQLVVDFNNNVGIGLTNPVHKLHVTGGYAGNALVALNETNGQTILTASSSGTTRLVLTNSGRLGVGTSNPGDVLQIGDSSGVHVRSSGAEVDVRFNTTSRSTIVQNNVVWSQGPTNAGGLRIGDGTNFAYALAKQGSSDLILNPVTGNVGIGSTTANAKLHITSATGVNSSMIFSQTGAQNWTIGNPASTLRFDISEADNLATPRLSINSGGNVGIGTTAPGANLQIAGPSAGAGYNRRLLITSNSHSVGGYQSIEFKDGITGGAGYAGVAGGATGPGVFGLDVNGESFIKFNTGGIMGSATERMRIDSVGNVGIGASTFGTNAAKVLAIAGSTAPTTAITDGIQLFAVDQAGSHELRVMDEAGNTTTLSPHNFSLTGGRSEDLAWSFYSERNSLAINADMTKALRLVEKLSGEKLVYLKDLTTGEMLEDASDATQVAALAEQGEISTVAKWNYQLWTFVGEVVFEKPVQFLADVTFKGRAIFGEAVAFNKRVTFADKDMAGFATITPGNTKVTITFAQPFEQAPVVTITPKSAVKLDWFRVTEESTTGFVIEIPSSQAQDIGFSWTALAVEQTSTSISQPVSITPTEIPTEVAPTPTPSPASSSQPILEPTPTPVPSPTLDTVESTSSAVVVGPAESASSSAEAL